MRATLILISSTCSSAKAICEANILPEILARVQPLKTRLKEWGDRVFVDQTAELDPGEFHPCVSLRLSHMTLELLLFRALLRAPIFLPTPSDDSPQPHSTILQDSQSCAKLSVELISHLTSKHFVGFWPPCTFYPSLHPASQEGLSIGIFDPQTVRS
jgi:hypothetical protein